MTKLTTPAGNPAASIARIRATAHADVVGAGTHTIVFPVAMPGAKYSTGMLTGKFHGVITA